MLNSTSFFRIPLTLAQRKEACPTCFQKNAAATDLVRLASRELTPEKSFAAEMFRLGRHLNPDSGGWAVTVYNLLCQSPALVCVLSVALFRAPSHSLSNGNSFKSSSRLVLGFPPHIIVSVIGRKTSQEDVHLVFETISISFPLTHFSNVLPNWRWNN